MVINSDEFGGRSDKALVIFRLMDESTFLFVFPSLSDFTTSGVL